MVDSWEEGGRESNLLLYNPSWPQPTRGLLVNIRESFLTEFCHPHCAGILLHLNMNCQLCDLCVAFYSPKRCTSHFGIFTCHVRSLYVAFQASFAFVSFVEHISVTTVVRGRFTRGSNTTASPSPVCIGGSCETGFSSSTGGNIKLIAATVFTKGTHSTKAVRGRGF